MLNNPSAKGVGTNRNEGDGFRISSFTRVTGEDYGSRDWRWVDVAESHRTFAADNVGNVIKKNVAHAGDAIDFLDANLGCGTNVWKGNVFERRNAPCIR